MDNLLNWLHPNQHQPLQSNAVHVWFYPLNLTPPCLDQLIPLLDAEELARSERLVHLVHRQRFIAAHGFMRSVLSRYTQQTANDLLFAKGEYGKPRLVNNAELHFNLSHSQDMAMLAIASEPVGIDIEYMDRKCDWLAIMQRFYTAPEIHKIMSLPCALQQHTFFQVWTRKEAYMKVTGKGLYLSPNEFTVSVPPEAAALLDLDSGLDITRWQMYDIVLPAMAKEYCACLSVAGSASQIVTFMYALPT